MITIYGKNGCSYCTKAKELCEKYDVNYEYKNIDENLDHLYEVLSRNKTMKTFPQIWWDDRHIGGYAELTSEFENLGIGNYGQGAF
jgi:glutaredoxin 1